MESEPEVYEITDSFEIISSSETDENVEIVINEKVHSPKVTVPYNGDPLYKVRILERGRKIQLEEKTELQNQSSLLDEIYDDCVKKGIVQNDWTRSKGEKLYFINRKLYFNLKIIFLFFLSSN